MKHRHGFTGWLEAVVDAVGRGVVPLPYLEDDVADAMVALVEHMVAFDPEERLTARDVERVCRRLKDEVGGWSLRDWSEVRVPWG